MLLNSCVGRLVNLQLSVCTSIKGSLQSGSTISWARNFQTTSCLNRVVVARPKKTKRKTNPVTYEEILPPHFIGFRKGFNSLNTSNLLAGSRSGETAIEDMFIRKFIEGTWHRLLLGKLIIKRRANLIILSGFFHQSLAPSKFYFLQGYTEEILAYVLKCPVKMEIMTCSDRKALVVTHV